MKAKMKAKMNIEFFPIETAPKDGTYVIVWPPTFPNVISYARWDDNRFAKYPKPFWRRVDSRSVLSDRNMPPTHWTPAFKIPKTKG